MLAKAHMGLLVIIVIALTTTTTLPQVTAANNQSQRTVAQSLTASSQQSRVARTSESVPGVKWAYTIGSYASTPVVGDVDGDNKSEIVVQSYRVYCLSGTGGVKWASLWEGAGRSCPAIGDVDGDNKLEILVAMEWQHRFYCLNGSGGVKWNDTTSDWFSESSPAIVDIDRDGKAEIIVGSVFAMYVNASVLSTPRIYCFNGSGGVKWSYLTRGSDVSRATVADIFGDGELEIVMGSVDHKVYCLNATGGSVWNYTTGGAIWSNCAIADIDGDGKQEVIVASSDSKIYCLNGSGGLKWSYATGHSISSSPAVADIDEDGKLEIVVTAHDGGFYCLNGLGEIEWSLGVEGAVDSSPVVGDVDGDGRPEIAAGSADFYSGSGLKHGQAVCCLNGTGGLKWAYDVGEDIYSAVAIADVDGDNKDEIVVTTFHGKVLCLSAFPSDGGFRLSSALLIGAGLLATFLVIVAVLATRAKSGKRIGWSKAGLSRKDKLLSKLSDEELLELARSFSRVPVDAKASRDNLTSIVKGHLSIEEIKEKVNRIRAASSQ